MLSSGQSESTSAINKRIVKSGGVRVLGKATPKPQIHVVQNTIMTQQQKVPDTFGLNDNSEPKQVGEKPKQEIIENAHIEDLHKETSKENDEETKKENSEVQTTAPPKPRRRRAQKEEYSEELQKGTAEKESDKEADKEIDKETRRR